MRNRTGKACCSGNLLGGGTTRGDWVGRDAAEPRIESVLAWKLDICNVFLGFPLLTTYSYE